VKIGEDSMGRREVEIGHWEKEEERKEKRE
jgi:hypothetical protein